MASCTTTIASPICASTSLPRAAHSPPVQTCAAISSGRSSTTSNGRKATAAASAWSTSTSRRSSARPRRLIDGSPSSSEAKRAEIDRRNIRGSGDRARPRQRVGHRGSCGLGPGGSRRDAEWARQCNDQIGSPGMPPRNAGADHCHVITAPSSARFEAKRAAQADGVRDPVFVVAERVLSGPPGNRAAEHDERSEQPDRVSEARAAGACPARHSLHGQRHDRVRRFERSLEMAGGDLSGRRVAVRPHVGRAPHLRALHLAANRACRVPHASPWPPRAALGLAGLLADVPADRVQPDAARRRHRHQLLLAAVCDAGLGAAAQGNSGPGALAGAARRLWRRAHRRRAGSGRVPGRRAVRAGERGPLRVGHRGRAGNDHDRIGANADPLPTGAAHRLLRPVAALGWTSPTPVDAAWIVFNGVSNAVGQYWWTRALHLAPASAVAPFNYLSLIWASILGFAIWGDVPTVSLVVGSAVVVASGLFLFWRESNARQGKPPANE